MSKNFNSLVIGYGSVGSRHAKNLIKLGYKNISVFRTFKNQLNYAMPKTVKIFKNLKNLMNLQKFKLVIIANPSSKHISHAIMAAKKKFNIYIEKPLSNNLKGIKQLKKLQNKFKIKILVGFQLRYHPGLILIKNLIKNKKLGKIYSVSSDVGEYLPMWHPNEDYKKSYASNKKLGGGVILTFIHEIDYLYWIFGEFKSVYANGGRLTKLKMNVEDTVIGNIMTKDKVPISLRMDYWRRPSTRTLNIVGEKGQIFWDYYKKETIILFNNGKKIVKKLPSKWKRNDMFLKILENFITAIIYKKNTTISLDEGIYSLKIALLIKKSLLKSKKILV
tara:strand:- start:1312 stop:2310 length:999 start_codon:yes stop_codon:yes gene_type:complete